GVWVEFSSGGSDLGNTLRARQNRNPGEKETRPIPVLRGRRPGKAAEQGAADISTGRRRGAENEPAADLAGVGTGRHAQANGAGHTAANYRGHDAGRTAGI